MYPQKKAPSPNISRFGFEWFPEEAQKKYSKFFDVALHQLKSMCFVYTSKQ